MGLVCIRLFVNIFIQIFMFYYVFVFTNSVVKMYASASKSLYFSTCKYINLSNQYVCTLTNKYLYKFTVINAFIVTKVTHLLRQFELVSNHIDIGFQSTHPCSRTVCLSSQQNLLLLHFQRIPSATQIRVILRTQKFS